MASKLISEAEKLFILHGVQDDLRVDGRSRKDVRPTTVEMDLVTHTSGSAHLKLANTDILVGVKAELEAPNSSNPGKGKLEFFVDCSANAAPEFEGRGGEDLATEISQMLSHSYQNVFDLDQLLVLENFHSWALYVDILILECGGNLFDAVSMAVKAALFNARIPRVSVTTVDGGEPEIEVPDDPHDGWKLKLNQAPILVTLSRIGNHCVVDPTLEEESCSSACLVIGVTSEGEITSVRKVGSGSFHMETVSEALKIGSEVGVSLNSALNKILSKQEKQSLISDTEKVGFLG